MGIDDIIPPGDDEIIITRNFAVIASVNALLKFAETPDATMRFRRILEEGHDKLCEVYCERDNTDRDR